MCASSASSSYRCLKVEDRELRLYMTLYYEGMHTCVPSSVVSYKIICILIFLYKKQLHVYKKICVSIILFLYRSGAIAKTQKSILYNIHTCKMFKTKTKNYFSFTVGRSWLAPRRAPTLIFCAVLVLCSAASCSGVTPRPIPAACGTCAVVRF